MAVSHRHTENRAGTWQTLSQLLSPTGEYARSIGISSTPAPKHFLLREFFGVSRRAAGFALL